MAFTSYFFLERVEQRIVGSGATLRSQGGVTHCGCALGWYVVFKIYVSLLEKKKFFSNSQEGSDYCPPDVSRKIQMGLKIKIHKRSQMLR